MSKSQLLCPPEPSSQRPRGVEGEATLSDGGVHGSRRLADFCLDWGERVVILALYGWLVARILLAYQAGGGLTSLLLLPSEGVVVFFMLVRRPSAQVSRRPAEWAMALLATSAPMLATPGGRPLLPDLLASTLLLMGLVIQVHAKLTLGRSFGCVPAHRGLKLSGPYRFVRHPMYAGYLLSHLAFLATNPTLGNLAAYAVCYGLQVPRLLAEERLLARDPCYRAYQSAVRFRLVPGLF